MSILMEINIKENTKNEKIQTAHILSECQDTLGSEMSNNTQ